MAIIDENLLVPGVLIEVNEDLYITIRNADTHIKRGHRMVVLTTIRDVNTWSSVACLWNETVVEIFESSLKMKCSIV